MTVESSPIYSKLAQLYDTLMSDVDYESWADYIDEIMQIHHPDPVEIMEVACGTGSITLSLAELECYKITGTDLSPSMIGIAQKKAKKMGLTLPFETADFNNLPYHNQFDCVYAVFDSINYLQNAQEIRDALVSIHQTLKSDGLFIFDFSTPKNSLESVDFLNEAEGESDNFRFFRKSWYENDKKLHFNEFEIQEKDQHSNKVIHTWHEKHKQRAYTLSEMLSILDQTPYHLVAKYDGFDLLDADETSSRVTIVLRCQKIQ
jgi:ubiquinone/menaquinone biosynthesis C-methylase UbiE